MFPIALFTAILAIPPAWVWICENPNGHLQCTGMDVKGRRQYRYHPSWHAPQNETNSTAFYYLERPFRN